MPTYNYTCGNDHTQEEFRAMADRKKPSKCNKCGAKALQTLSAPAIRTMIAYDRFTRDHEVEGNGVRSQ